MSPRQSTVTLLIAVVLALSAQGCFSAVLRSQQQQEAFDLHHRAALRGLAAVNKANELRAAVAAKSAALAAPAAKTSSAPAAAAPTSDAMWRQFVLDRLSQEIALQQKKSGPAPLPAVTLTQTTLERLLTAGKAQTSTAWYKAAALKLRAAMEADRLAVLAKKRGGAAAPAPATTEAQAPATVDTEVPRLNGDELSFIRDMLEEAKEGDIILPK